MISIAAELANASHYTPPPPDETEEWGDADLTLLTGKGRDIPSFPCELLGASWSGFVLSAAASKSAPPDYVACALLSAAAGLIGNARKIQVWPGWEEPTALWFMLVGTPSSNKSPACDAVFPVVHELERDLNRNYEAELDAYHHQKEIADIRRAEWRSKVKEKGDLSLPDDAQEPEKPARKRLLITESTIEKVAALLGQNPKGLILHRDELAGLLANMERRGGSDQQFYLEAFGGRSFVVDRQKLDEPIEIPSLLLSLIGSIQPARLQKLVLEKEDDGMAARFLYTWPEPVTLSKPAAPPDAYLIQTALRRLCGLSMAVDGNGHAAPVTTPLEASAHADLLAWEEERAQREREEDGLMVSHIGKLRGIAARMALILAYLEWATTPDTPEPELIEHVYLTRAIGLMDAYFIPMAERCFGDACMAQDYRDALTLIKWALRGGVKVIDAGRLPRMQRSPLKDRKRRDMALEVLEGMGLIRLQAQEEAHRPRLIYEIHPDVLAWGGRHGSR